MKKNRLILFSFLSIIILQGFLPTKEMDDKLGFTLNVDGDQFNDQTFFIPASDATYCNLYFDFKDDPKAKRTVLLGFKADNSLQLFIDAPIHKIPGSFTFIEDSIPTYMGFQFTFENKEWQSITYLPGKITVNITKYGKVGEFIEGNFSGKLHSGEREITATGTFKVKRIKDRV